jgi:hypothetical protein
VFDRTDTEKLMPAGPMPLGLAYFAAVKFAGYTAAGVWLNRRYGQSARTPFAFGMARTALGVAAGFAFGFLALGLGLTKSELAFYLLLAPIRLAEWSLIIWLFYGREEPDLRRLVVYATLGSLWSYVLDLPAILAVFILPGGAWIC